MMAQAYALSGGADTYNQTGCPFWNQTLRDVVQDCSNVLAKIDIPSLSPDLQCELKRLQLKYAHADASLPAP